VDAEEDRVNTPLPQEATVRALKTMWRKRWEEAESRASDLSALDDPMSGEWSTALDRLVVLRVEMREIGRATAWAEAGSPSAATKINETLQEEHGALVTAQGEMV
jgi:hypothetical protein